MLTNENGAYSVTLPTGAYKFIITSDGYVESDEEVYVSDTDRFEYFHLTAQPDDEDEYRLKIILKWSDTPEDIDSHLLKVSDEDFHIYFRNMSQDDCELDRDDRDGYGPETLTIYSDDDDKYSYYVHDYTNEDYYNSSDMSNFSSAVVYVYNKDGLWKKYKMPAGVEGTVWHVFDYDASTDEITYVNEWSSAKVPEDVGTEYDE